MIAQHKTTQYRGTRFKKIDNIKIMLFIKTLFKKSRWLSVSQLPISGFLGLSFSGDEMLPKWNTEIKKFSYLSNIQSKLQSEPFSVIARNFEDFEECSLGAEIMHSEMFFWWFIFEPFSL